MSEETLRRIQELETKNTNLIAQAAKDAETIRSYKAKSLSLQQELGDASSKLATALRAKRDYNNDKATASEMLTGMVEIREKAEEGLVRISPLVTLDLPEDIRNLVTIASSNMHWIVGKSRMLTMSHGPEIADEESDDQ